MTRRVARLSALARPLRDAIEKRALYHHGIDLYSTFMSRGDLAFDIGALAGSRVKMFRGLGARVVAIEPQPFFARALRQAFKNDPDVVVVEKGVAETEGVMDFYVCPDHPGISSMADHWREIRFPEMRWDKIRVPVTTLNALISEYGVPTFCKIDVEGMEGPVLRGLTNPLPTLSFEFTGLFLDDARANLQYLEGLGPIWVNCSLYESMELLMEGWVKPERLVERLDLISENDSTLSGDIYVSFLPRD